MNPYAPPKARVSDPPHDDGPSAWVTKLLALFFAFLSVFMLLTLLNQLSLLPVAVACVCSVASIGLWRSRPWSRWVVYLVSTLFCVYFAWFVWTLVQGRWPVVSVIPGLTLLMFGVASAVHVRRVFRNSGVDA
jgi:uncharacterized BrkB/YihY/UPF0761 family membrane protein